MLPGIDKPEDEKATLDESILEHAGDPMYRYAPQRGGLLVDPNAQTEDIGDDPVKASGYAIENLKRVVPNLSAWTSTPGQDFDDLDEIYGELLFQWNRYIGHVVTVIGGAHQNLKATDQDGPVFTPVPRAEQRAAVEFLIAQVFQTPTWLNDEEILRRIEHAGAVDRIRAIQVTRLGHLLERTPVDVSQSDIRPFVRGELKELRGAVERAARRASDRATRYHLDDVIVRIDAILDVED